MRNDKLNGVYDNAVTRQRERWVEGELIAQTTYDFSKADGKFPWGCFGFTPPDSVTMNISKYNNCRFQLEDGDIIHVVQYFADMGTYTMCVPRWLIEACLDNRICCVAKRDTYVLTSVGFEKVHDGMFITRNEMTGEMNLANELALTKLRQV